MRLKKLKELLVYAIINKSAEVVTISKKELLEEGLMKLNAEELEILEECIDGLLEATKPKKRKVAEEADRTEEQEEQLLEAI